MKKKHKVVIYRKREFIECRADYILNLGEGKYLMFSCGAIWFVELGYNFDYSKAYDYDEM